MAKQKYWNGTTWEVVGTDAAKVALLDSAGKFGATNVEAAMLELFTFANNGKTSIANAVNAKGIAATSADTFPTLATKIGQITTGDKKFASGSFASSTAQTLTVSGLTFKPSIILIHPIDREDGVTTITLYAELLGSLYAYFAGSNTRHLLTDRSEYVNAGAFSLGYYHSYVPGQMVNWVAYE
jgi:hypothetical protein